RRSASISRSGMSRSTRRSSLTAGPGRMTDGPRSAVTLGRMASTPRSEPATHPDWLVGPDTVAWSEVEERLRTTRNYWVATARADGRPHTRPVWGLWLEGGLVLSAGGGYWMMRNVRLNPAVSVHPEQAEGL